MRAPVALLAALVLGSPLALLSGAPGAHAAGIGKPPVGVCYHLTVAGLNQTTNSAKPVACAKPHTTYTAGVPNLPPQLSYGSSQNAIAAAAVKVCAKPFAKAVGGQYTQRAITRYQTKFFEPTKAQIQAGARWVRCDVIFLAGKTVAPLPPGAAPFLKKGVTKAMTRCGDKPGTTTLTYLPCNKAHGYRATGAFKVAKKAYPTSAQFQTLVVKNCRRYLGRSAGYATIRDQLTWETGDRTITCFMKTHS